MASAAGAAAVTRLVGNGEAALRWQASRQARHLRYQRTVQVAPHGCLAVGISTVQWMGGGRVGS